jgi:16S rRNA (cytosine967-C5)-methyltransferase
LRLTAYEKIFQASIPDYAIGAQAVALARRVAGDHAAGFVNAIVRRLLPTLPASPEALATDPFVAGLDPATRWSVPPDMVGALAEGYGREAFAEILPALAGRESPVWLRVNTLRATPEAARDALAAEGVAVATPPTPAPLAEALLWQDGGERLPWQTAAWARGEVTAQDLGAMLAAVALDPKPGQSVLDACAAPGGKTGHFWQRMEGRGRLVALEVDPARRRVLAESLERLFGAGHGIAQPEAAALEALPGATAGLPERYDRVILDAPCLALGLIGRHPEIRWDGRLRHAEAMVAKQAALLRAGAERVAPGGRLLWMTCSPTRLENEAVVEGWLAEHPGWRLVDPAERLGAAWRELLELSGGWARTRPDRVACDGFAMALLERAGAS